MRDLHIIEPGLYSFGGHGFSLVESIVRSWLSIHNNSAVSVWVDKRFACEALHGVLGDRRVVIRKNFRRRTRRFQVALIYRDLLKTDSVVFISTARLLDALVLRLMLPKVSNCKVFLYIHWFKCTRNRVSLLRWAVGGVPTLKVLVSTERLEGAFRKARIPRVSYQCYPFTDTATQTGVENKFSHLLYAGSARADKGFERLVDLLELMAARGVVPPVVVQTYSEKGCKIPGDLAVSLLRLRTLAEKNTQIRMVEMALNPREYRALFRGALTIQLYDSGTFHQRVSGVTLDSISLGAVPFVNSGTWAAEFLNSLGVGVVARSEGLTEICNQLEQSIESYQQLASEVSRIRSDLAVSKNWLEFLGQIEC